MAILIAAMPMARSGFKSVVVADVEQLLEREARVPEEAKPLNVAMRRPTRDLVVSGVADSIAVA